MNRRSCECFADNVLNHQNFKWSLVQRFPQQTSTDTLFWLRGSFSASSSDINTSRLLQLFNYYQLGPARPGSARPGPPPLLIGPIWEKDCRLNLFHAASGPWLGEIGWDPAEDEGGGGGGDGASNRWRCREREREVSKCSVSICRSSSDRLLTTTTSQSEQTSQSNLHKTERPFSPSVSLPVYLSVYTCTYLSVYLSVYRRTRLCTCLSTCLCTCLSVYLSVC